MDASCVSSRIYFLVLHLNPIKFWDKFNLIVSHAIIFFSTRSCIQLLR